ncbi:MAG: hypothetical protein Q8K60_05610 [Parachlamydiaceae bacterium]|nr:hypothetical protein [Parachlamydiaceae bacterium]
MSRFRIVFLLMTIILMGCKPKIVGEGPWLKKIDSEELSKIVINFSVLMKIEKHLELEDSWAGYDDYITQIVLRYSSQRLLTVYDARQVMVELVEEFLSRINNNSIISFELNRYPFTYKDLDVKINFESYFGRYIDELYVGTAWLHNGCLLFYAFDRKDMSLNGIDWDHTRFEPYTKSRELAILKREAEAPFVESLETREFPPAKPSTYVYQKYFSPI